MTPEELAAHEEEMREKARQTAIRALTFGPLVAGVVILAVLALTVGNLLAFLGK